MRRPRPWAYGFGLLTLAILLAPPSVFWLMRERETLRAQQALQDAIETTNRLDPEWQWSHFRTDLPETATVTGHLRRIGLTPWSGRGGPEERIDFFFDRWMMIPENELPDDYAVQQLQDALTKLEQLTERIEALPASVKQGEVAHDAPSIFHRATPLATAAKHASRLLRGQSVQQMATAGSIDITTIERLMRISQALDREPHLITQAMHETLLLETNRCIERLLGCSNASTSLDTWQAHLEERLHYPVLQHAMRGERAWWDAIFRQVEDGSLSLSDLMINFAGLTPTPTPVPVEAYRLLPRIGYAHAEMLLWFNELIAITQLPLHEQRLAFRQLEVPQRFEVHAALRNMYRYSFESLLVQTLTTRTITSSMVVALACERYRLDHGEWPKDLEVLQPRYLQHIPNDPVNGQRLRYSLRSDGICIYGVGHDGIDNDGNLSDYRYSHSTDIGVRLWNPSERGRPYFERLSRAPQVVTDR